MDPISALSLACNIFTVIDLSQQLASGMYEVYTSVDGAKSENRDLMETTRSLEASLSALNTPLQFSGASPATTDEAALTELAQKCKTISEKLLTLLETLRAKKPQSKLESARVGFRHMRKKAEVESLSKRVDKYHAQILSQIVIIIR